MHEYDELSSCRSMKFGTDNPAQFAVPETVHPSFHIEGKILTCVSRNLQPATGLDSGGQNAGCLRQPFLEGDACLKGHGHDQSCP